MVVGSKVNAYINLGFFLNWQIAANTNLKAGIDVTHYSMVTPVILMPG